MPLLTFDKRFDIGVPHDKPDVVHAFVVKNFRNTSPRIRGSPGCAGSATRPDGKAVAAEVRVLTPAQWVAERTAGAEELLWRKTCKQCHALSAVKGASLPAWRMPASPNAGCPRALRSRCPPRFLLHGCHPSALTSKETSDVLVPPLANCKTCHAPGPDRAESRCFECTPITIGRNGKK